MSLAILFGLLALVLVYWVWTQILPERERTSLLRPGLGEGLLETLNQRRRAEGLPLLEVDDDLMIVAENKAVHQIMTGESGEGWDYPPEFRGMFGRSLLLESLLIGSMETMGDRLSKHRDLMDGAWIRCGIGVAGGRSGQVVVALVLCRQAWEPAADVVYGLALSD